MGAGQQECSDRKKHPGRCSDLCRLQGYRLQQLADGSDLILPQQFHAQDGPAYFRLLALFGQKVLAQAPALHLSIHVSGRHAVQTLPWALSKRCALRHCLELQRAGGSWPASES